MSVVLHSPFGSVELNFVELFLIAFAHRSSSKSESIEKIGAGGFSANGANTKLTSNLTGELAGFKLIALGNSLDVDGNGEPNAGTITSFELKETATGKTSTFELQVPMSASAFVAAVAAGSGDYSAKNYQAAYDLLIPTFITINGSAGNEIFEGNHADDIFIGKGGNDTFIMYQGDDEMIGGNGKDTVSAQDLTVGIKANLKKGWVKYDGDKAILTSVENVIGSKKADTIIGDKNANVLAGGKGNDKLTGDKGKDKFVFAKKGGKDTITDFEDGKDKIDLSAYNFKNKNKALSKFSELGNNHDDKVNFDYKGTEIVIKGIDLSDLSGADIII